MNRVKQEIGRLAEEIERLEGDRTDREAHLAEDEADVTTLCIEESIAALRHRIINLAGC